MDNFAAVHWYANRHIKRDKIPVSTIPVAARALVCPDVDLPEGIRPLRPCSECL